MEMAKSSFVYIVVYFRSELCIAGRTCPQRSKVRGAQLGSPSDLAVRTVPIVTAVINLL